MKTYILFVVLSIVTFVASATDRPSKLIIDNDAGGDDAMAIFLAVLYEKHFNGPNLIGLTTVNGNTNEENVCTNNQRILKVAGRQDVPIFRGSRTSLVTTPESAEWYGKDGLGDTGEVVTNLISAQPKDAVSALIEFSKLYEGHLTVVSLGPLTNIALALKMDPKFISRLAQLYVGAGHIYSDEHPQAEFNAKMDVEAYHVVAQHANPEKVTILPFSQVRKTCNFSMPWRKEVLGGIKTDIMTEQNKYEKVSLARTDRWLALDPAAVAIAVKPELVNEYKYSKNSITLCGEKRGINTNEFDHKDANVRIAYSIKTEEYKQFLLDVFALQ